MLKAISDAGNGMYYFIENEDKVTTLFTFSYTYILFINYRYVYIYECVNVYICGIK